MQNRRRASTDVRNRILEATLDELGATGEGITLQAVARRADVALRTLYNHFGGRDELLAAAFVHHTEQTRADVEAVSVPDADPEVQLRHVVEAFHRRYARMGPRLGVQLSLRGFPELDEQIHTVRGWRTRMLGEIVERAGQAGTLRLSPATAVALAFTLTSHAAWQTLRDQVDGDSAAATRAATESLCSALFHR
jgi:AcrR family transcriptional regulator